VIYLIGPEESAIVKIGHTTNQPSFRLGNLQTGNHERLVVRWAGNGDESLEKHLHAVFKAYRIRGEWFDLSPLEDPVQAVKDEIRKASERQARGDGLLAAERHHDTSPQPDLRAFDQVPSKVDLDLERPPVISLGRVTSVAEQGRRTWDDRFGPVRGEPVVAETGHAPKTGCIRVWQGRCLRPKNTTCGC